MSMICHLLGLSPSQIDSLRATPALASALTLVASADLYRANTEEMLKQMAPEQRARFEESHAKYKASAAAKEYDAHITTARKQIGALGPFEPALSLEKSWHILHYLFTGHLGPASAPGDLLLTGEELGDDVGYGPARLHTPAETQDFSVFLETLDSERLQARLNLTEMRRLGVYSMPVGPPSSDAEFEGELRQEVGNFFPRLKEYVRRKSDQGNGMLIWVS